MRPTLEQLKQAIEGRDVRWSDAQLAELLEMAIQMIAGQSRTILPEHEEEIILHLAKQLVDGPPVERVARPGESP